jgi:hypothetical protein
VCLMLSHPTLAATLVEEYGCSHLTVEEAEAQRSELNFLRLHS